MCIDQLEYANLKNLYCTLFINSYEFYKKYGCIINNYYRFHFRISHLIAPTGNNINIFSDCHFIVEINN